MRIAILSDTHSRYETVEKALKLAQEKQVELILHCGDITDADTVWLFPPNSHFVFGNCDWDRASLQQAIHGIGATLHQPFGDLEFSGVRLGFVHSDDQRLFRAMETSNQYDFLFYGHTHQAAEHRTGRTRVINPGALQRAQVKTFVVLEVETGAVESVFVE